MNMELVSVGEEDADEDHGGAYEGEGCHRLAEDEGTDDDRSDWVQINIIGSFQGADLLVHPTPEEET